MEFNINQWKGENCAFTFLQNAQM